MGKILIIKNADFSANAIEQIVPPTPVKHNYIHLTRLTDDTIFRACYNNIIAVGKKVGFADAQMWRKYKMAIALSNPWPDITVWDTQYSGDSYNTNNIIILNQAVQIMIAPINSSSITEQQIEEINNNAFYVDD